MAPSSLKHKKVVSHKKATSKVKSPKSTAEKSISKKAEPIQIPEKRKSINQQYAIGRRKSAIARVYYFINPAHEIFINNKPLEAYFNHSALQQIVRQPLLATSHEKGKWVIRVVGGGKRGQAESIRLGIARLLVGLDNSQKPTLKKNKFLTRDSRVKERKKYGLKRARRAPQWQKR